MTRSYMIKFKRPGMLFWRRVWFAIGDCVGPRVFDDGKPMPGCELFLHVNTKFGARWEIPFNGTMFRYGRRRHLNEIDKTNAEARQEVVK